MKQPRYFSRGEGPLCSVLIPSRGRPDQLVMAMLSCWELAKDKRNVEFVLRLDEDDPESYEAAKDFYEEREIAIKAVVDHRGNGYLDSPLWCRQMSEKAEGDWLLLFNDDARMITQGWDELLAAVSPDCSWHGTDDVFLAEAETVGSPYSHEFPFLRKAAFEVLGRWGLSPQSDTWMWQIMSMLGSAFTLPIRVSHLEEREQDATRRELLEAMGSPEASYNRPEWIRMRIGDSMRLLEKIELDLMAEGMP